MAWRALGVAWRARPPRRWSSWRRSAFPPWCWSARSKRTGYLAAGQVLRAKLPQATLVQIPDAGHCVNIEQTEAFDRAVLDFLRAQGLPRPRAASTGDTG